MKLALLLAFTATNAGQAFDLDCTGTTRITSAGQPDEANPWHDVIRVNLADGRFCQEACKDPQPIAKITTTKLFFRIREDGNGTGVDYVDRETGEYSSYLPFGRSSFIKTDGKCRRRPFSGWAKVKTRF